MAQIKNANVDKVTGEQLDGPNEKLSANAEAHGSDRPEVTALTLEVMRERIFQGIDALSMAAYDPELRVIADNGKRYPLDTTLPPGVQTDGELIVVGRFAWLQKQLASVVVWKLETLVDDGETAVSEQRKKIARARRDLERNIGGWTERSIEAMDSFLDLKLEEQSLRVAMFNAARDGYLDATGEDYETRAMRAERERFAQSAARVDARNPEREARANRFG